MNGTIVRYLMRWTAVVTVGAGISCLNPGGTEVENEKTVTVYLSDGKTPAVGAKIAIFQSNDTTHIPVYSATTDSRGRYTVDSIRFQNGYYNVNSRLEEFAALQDSVFIINSNTSVIANDTLFATRSVAGYASLQPNHNVQTVTVHAVGTNVRVNVDARGFFTLEDLAPGKYTLMVVSTLTDYTPLYHRLTVSQSSPDTIPDTLRLAYTGIPIVTGLSASYDTLHGIVKVWWHATSYFDFQRYNVYRAHADSISWPAKPVFIPQDTVILDTLTFKDDTIGIDSAVIPIVAPASVHSLKYRVTVVDNTDREGLPYKYIRVDAIPPAQATKVTDYGTFVPLPRHGLCTLKVSPGVWYGRVQKVEWDFGNTGSFSASQGFDTVFSVPEDSIITNYPCVVRITGAQNRIGIDTIALQTQVRPAMIAKLPFVNDTSNGIIPHSAVVFKNKLFVFYQQWSSWSTKMLSSADGIVWQTGSDSIYGGGIKTSVVFKGKLFVLNRQGNNFLLASENGSSFNAVPMPPLDTITLRDTMGDMGFLTVHDSLLYLNTADGVWACDSTLVWKKVAPGIPNDLFSTFNHQFTLNKIDIVFGSGSGWTPAVFYKTSDFIGYTKLSEFQYPFNSYEGLPFLCDGKYVVMIHATAGMPILSRILYSTDAVSWLQIGSTNKNIREAVHFNGKDLLFGSDGTVYELK
jgi:hypothetical protein